MLTSAERLFASGKLLSTDTGILLTRNELLFTSNEQLFTSNEQMFTSNEQLFTSSEQMFTSNEQLFTSSDPPFASPKLFLRIPHASASQTEQNPLGTRFLTPNPSSAHAKPRPLAPSPQQKMRGNALPKRKK